MRKIIPYNPALIPFAKKLRNNMTLGEIALWREIKNKKLGVRFSRQIRIDQYIVDFYCKELQLAIEVDGSIHFEEGQQEKDAYRQKRLESLGVKFIRFSDLDVKNNLSWVLGEINEAIENSKKPTPNLPKKYRDKLSEEGNSSVL
jgi:very-short-patch-repair endonuclease